MRELRGHELGRRATVERELRLAPVLCSALLLAACSDSSDSPVGPDGGSGGGSQLPTTEEWAERVDSFFGPAPSVDQRLAVFDEVWTMLSEDFAGFGALDVDWDAVRSELRPRAESASTYGRFYQVISEMVSRLPDMHTVIHSVEVCLLNDPQFFVQRPPVLIQYYERSRLGICVTPDTNDDLMVYSAEPGNPTGLEPGDVIVGLDGASPAEVLQLLDEWQLPLCGSRDSPPISDHFSRLTERVHDNTHLFQTVQVRRFATGTVESLPTEAWLQNMSLLACRDQLPVAGVAFPWTDMPINDPNARDVSWGRAEGTNVGYIYVYGTSDAIAQLFDDAVTALWATHGLIIDLRFNSGGVMPIDTGGSMDAGIRQLFQTEIPNMFQLAVRDSASTDRTALTVIQQLSLRVDPATYYDHPIAVLTGPRAGSGGDFAVYALARHPRAQRFGLPTHGAFGSQYAFTLTSSDDILGAYANGAALDSAGVLLKGAVQTAEHPVWLTTSDSALGTDSVVQAALTWIAQSSP